MHPTVGPVDVTAAQIISPHVELGILFRFIGDNDRFGRSLANCALFIVVQISQSEGAGCANVVVAAGADGAVFVERGAVADETVLVVFALFAWRLGQAMIVVGDAVLFGLEGVESGVDGYDEGRSIGISGSGVVACRWSEVFGASACKVGVASASAAAAATSASTASSLVFAGFRAHACRLERGLNASSCRDVLIGGGEEGRGGERRRRRREKRIQS